MGNMGYCRFENTASDLADCADHITDKLGSEYEQAGRKSLIRSCIDILETLGYSIDDSEATLAEELDGDDDEDLDDDEGK